MMASESPTAFVLPFVRAMNESDMATVRACFDPDVRAFVTNAAGGTDLVEGSEALGLRFPDFAAMADSFRATVTQVHEIDDRTVLFMVEIRAETPGAIAAQLRRDTHPALDPGQDDRIPHGGGAARRK
jgi:hypothetical protein